MKALQRIKNSRLGAVVKDERGLSTVEYVILLVLIAAVAVGTWRTLGDYIAENLEGAERKLRDGLDR